VFCERRSQQCAKEVAKARVAEAKPHMSALPALESHTRSVRIIVPARNEALRVERTIDRLRAHFADRATILVVANGCTDTTVPLVKALTRAYETVELLEIPEDVGKGGAIRAGLTLGKEPYVAFVDADTSTPPEQLDVLLSACTADGVSGAIASRWLPASRIVHRQPLQRRLASRAFNAIVRLLFGLPYTDTQCGAKVFERSAIDLVIDQLEIANFAFDVDLLLLLTRCGKRVVEVPIVWDDVSEYSKVRLVTATPAMLLAMLRLSLRDGLLRNVPFAEDLGKRGTLPVRRGLDVLFLLPPGAERVPAVKTLVASLRVRGHIARVYRMANILDVLRLLPWYAQRGRRKVDAIVHGFDASNRILGLSAKPKLTLTQLGSLAETSSNWTDRYIDEIVGSAQRPLHFRRNDDGWHLAARRLETHSEETSRAV